MVYLLLSFPPESPQVSALRAHSHYAMIMVNLFLAIDLNDYNDHKRDE